ncbi:hypothetical protein PP175_14950 [Aneurinibacillus sp. Ricciae_BoGa-3]|uniref:hypothetical protein n=1 Tax=Aneurinibacillus sp. Ricciae_BoGa-3 TaxID=3022697 RepID=UPI0023414718|nr:hypothetical protein [Aneurinibacillus sp. Ricciae_BoGa-3]WCK52726.1 hypothetical protein PP175_14950 [Aneurinibacillus sp. Ricciae_BoGa-3]
MSELFLLGGRKKGNSTTTHITTHIAPITRRAHTTITIIMFIIRLITRHPRTMLIRPITMGMDNATAVATAPVIQDKAIRLSYTSAGKICSFC